MLVSYALWCSYQIRGFPSSNETGGEFRYPFDHQFDYVTSLHMEVGCLRRIWKLGAKERGGWNC